MCGREVVPLAGTTVFRSVWSRRTLWGRYGHLFPLGVLVTSAVLQIVPTGLRVGVRRTGCPTTRCGAVPPLRAFGVSSCLTLVSGGWGCPSLVPGRQGIVYLSFRRRLLLDFEGLLVASVPLSDLVEGRL